MHLPRRGVVLRGLLLKIRAKVLLTFVKNE